ncbi:M23 family metallopeptidase [Haladaptatus sp. CMAA 1911]|uniref:M23 family metallopeptidase n=1 Tax=unclassified Haladaptatus TaxID=2622732 RepID=UPI003754AD8B
MSSTRSLAESGDGDESNRREGILARLPDPTNLFLLGFISIPGYLFPKLRPLQRFALFFLFGMWPFVRGVLPSFGGDEEDPTDWIAIGGKSYTRRSRLSLLLLQLNPFVFVQGVLQFAGHVPILLRYRGRLPNPDRFEQSGSYRLPFGDASVRDESTDDGGAAVTDGGTWTVINGGPTREHSHSWSILTQRYAYDFVITDDKGRTHVGDGSRPEQYFCYGEPILAPADGVVVEAHDGHRDGPRAGGWLDLRQRNILGNHVTIEHADGEYSVSAHLQRGSVTVTEGDRVERGQRVGRCGHSGNSTEPHLHFHVQDRPNFYLGMGLPIRFDGVRTTTENPTDGGRTVNDEEAANGRYISAGQRVVSNPE